MKLTHEFDLDSEMVKSLQDLREAMILFSIESGDTREEAEEYNSMQQVFDFVMQLGQNHFIPKRIENAAYYYDKYYEKYPYKYGIDRTTKVLKEDPNGDTAYF